MYINTIDEPAVQEDKHKNNADVFDDLLCDVVFLQERASNLFNNLNERSNNAYRWRKKINMPTNNT